MSFSTNNNHFSQVCKRAAKHVRQYCSEQYAEVLHTMHKIHPRADWFAEQLNKLKSEHNGSETMNGVADGIAEVLIYLNQRLQYKCNLVTDARRQAEVVRERMTTCFASATFASKSCDLTINSRPPFTDSLLFSFSTRYTPVVASNHNKTAHYRPLVNASNTSLHIFCLTTIQQVHELTIGSKYNVALFPPRRPLHVPYDDAQRFVDVRFSSGATPLAHHLH